MDEYEKEYKSWQDEWKPLPPRPVDPRDNELAEPYLIKYPSQLDNTNLLRNVYGWDCNVAVKYFLNCVYPEHLYNCLRLPSAFPVIE